MSLTEELSEYRGVEKTLKIIFIYILDYHFSNGVSDEEG